MPSIQAVLATSTPNLLSADAGASGGNTCAAEGNWIGIPGWATTSPNDAGYQIDIDVSTEQTPVSFSSLVTGRTTFSSGYNDNTGLQGNTGGITSPTTNYRTYRVKLVRKSDSFVMKQIDTNTISITFFSDACA